MYYISDMGEYTFKNGVTVSCAELRMVEDRGYSEQQIADHIGVSRMSLYSARKRMGCEVRFRSDRGRVRRSKSEARAKRAAYMRGYREQNPVKKGFHRGSERVDIAVYEYRGRKKSLPDWSEELGIALGTLYSRLRKGWSVDEAFGIKPGRVGNIWDWRKKHPKGE